MRHTFLPNQDQKVLKRSYRARVLIVTFFFFSLAAVVGMVSLFPSYMQVVMQQRSQVQALDSLMDNESTRRFESIRAELDSDMKRLTLLSGTDLVQPSTLIADTIEMRGSVRITAISVDTIATTSATLVVQGIAPTRDSLVSFKTRLENRSMGNKVELPISEFTKSKDIPFSLKYTTIFP